VEDIQAIVNELNYKKAQNSLRNLVTNLDLTVSERVGLESTIENLSVVLDKLDRSVVQIAAFGMVGRGKSSVLNALVGKEIFKVGPLHGVTREIGRVDWYLETENLDREEILQRLTLTGGDRSQIQLLDTPGIDEVNGEVRETLARKIAREVDLILFVVSGDITQVEYRALSQLREAGKPMILVFNQIDRYPEADRLAIYRKICDERVKQLLSPDEIVMVAASPLLTKAVREIDGRVKVERYRGEPEILELKLKILEILDREGKSLIALNSMLYASEANELVVQRKMVVREAAAERAIQKAVSVKALAVALNPVTAIDLLTGAIVDVAIVVALSRIYGLSMNSLDAIALLKKIALSMGGITISETLTSLGLSSLKSLLGLAAPVTGGLSLVPYASVAIAQAGVAGVFCWAIAQATKTYLANGASWGPDGPKAVVTHILDSLDEESILNRIKDELRHTQ
jgi:hypothetical protein